eukprot:TRINITY_DN503_c0_g1_i10.p4 TRINITY_DN503_c0_g1~~TRINITY_DN503_c0_g1_i10.p4  ORF type:complete len:127 (-),score=17.34 TRINITY_DN503_c0_g1_i10:858-1238(-)
MMSRTLLVVIAVFFFLLAKNGEAQPGFSAASVAADAAATAQTAVPKGLQASLVGGSETVEVKAAQGMFTPFGKCQCPLPSFHCGGCQRMRCIMICTNPWQWKICLYCSPCEAQTAGFSPNLHCWYV